MVARRGLTALLVAGLLVVGCSSDSKAPSAAPTSSAAPPSSADTVDRSTFQGAVCASITSWMNRMVDTTNSFSDDSSKLSVPERRNRYAAAFDGLTKLTVDLHDDLAQTPTLGTTPTDADAVRAELDKAIEQVKTQIAGNKDQAGALSDADYGFQAVNEGHLFTGTEKALSTVLKALNEQGRLHTMPELEGTCGRR